MPLQATSGAASYDAFGGGAAVVPTYIEEVFSTYLYTGTGASLPIVNGIDLSTFGGLVWSKRRSGAAQNKWYDSARGIQYAIESDTTDANQTEVTGITSFNSDGYTYGTDGNTNSSGSTNVSWTFRKQPKFFDVVTYTGTGSNTTIAHALGSVPGSIIVKRTDTTAAWAVYHRSLANTEYLVLNSTAAKATGATWWNSTTPTSSVFSVGTDASVNASGGTYVAYLFAHDAGGFGLTGTDNVISCGSFTTVASEATINLGYEPQWVMVKSSSASGTNWQMYDTMRGFNGGNFTATTTAALNANSSSAESITGDAFPTATGFVFSGAASATYIYIAIRRGPMKVPTLGTSVFSPVTSSASTGTVLTTSFPVDLQIVANRTATDNKYFMDRLRGVSTPGAAISTPILYSNLTDAEVTNGTATRSFDNTSFQMPGLFNGYSTIFYNFRRAPGFFDEACYTGTGSATTQTHNLGVAPELAIVKSRNVAASWYVQNAQQMAAYTGVSPGGYTLSLSTTAALTDGGGNYVYNPTASTISLDNGVNFNTRTYVAYLFASLAGVSKVFSYTGNGSSQTINCGFTGGARFVLIKRTDSTGDWYVWDSARGIVAGNDPHLSLNTTAAEVTTDDSVDTDNTGFIVNQVAATNVNVSSATYIGLAIA